MMKLVRLSVLLTILVFLMVWAMPSKVSASDKGHLSYFADPSGNMTILEVADSADKGRFVKFDGRLPVGYSHSAYWIKFESGYFDDLSPRNEDLAYLVVMNTLLADAELYLPIGKGSYEIFSSGYENSSKTQVDGFVCPVFAIPSSNFSQPIYLKVASPNTLNTKIMSMNRQQLASYRQMLTLSIGSFFGIFLTLFIYNLTAFLKLRNGFYLSFVLYIVVIILYQSAYTGAVQLLPGWIPDFLQEHITFLGLLTTSGMIIFVKYFMNTSKFLPRHNAGLKFFLALMAVSGALHTLGFRELAFGVAFLLAYSNGVLLILTAIAGLKKDMWQAKYFLAACILVTVSLVVLSLRGVGIIPNTALTTLTPIIFASAELIVLTMAMTERLHQLQIYLALKEEHLLKEQANTKAAELAFLHAQIKPHFLFNAMNSIATLCTIRPEDAKKLLMDLALYLQHIYAFTNLTGKISLESEISYIQAYLRIQQVRFGDALQVRFDLEDIKGAWLPPLVIEPLVENAIRHGIRKSTTEGTIVIRVKRTAEGIRVEVEDDGVGIPQSKVESIFTLPTSEEKGIGLANVDMRLRAIYSKGLAISSEEGKGTKVWFVIPWNEKEDYESDTD